MGQCSVNYYVSAKFGRKFLLLLFNPSINGTIISHTIVYLLVLFGEVEVLHFAAIFVTSLLHHFRIFSSNCTEKLRSGNISYECEIQQNSNLSLLRFLYLTDNDSAC